MKKKSQAIYKNEIARTFNTWIRPHTYTYTRNLTIEKKNTQTNKANVRVNTFIFLTKLYTHTETKKIQFFL